MPITAPNMDPFDAKTVNSTVHQAASLAKSKGWSYQLMCDRCRGHLLQRRLEAGVRASSREIDDSRRDGPPFDKEFSDRNG